MHETSSDEALLNDALKRIEDLFREGNRDAAVAAASALPLIAYAKGKAFFVQAFSTGFRTDAAWLWTEMTMGDATAESLAA